MLEEPVAPKGTAFEPDLYGAPPATAWEHHDPNIIETEVLSPIDSATALVLKKLTCDLPILDAAERRSWAQFLVSLFHRHRDTILERDQHAPALARETLARMLAGYERAEDRALVIDALDGLDLTQTAKTAHRTLMVRSIRDERATDAINALAWDILTIRAPLHFITTDRPLLINAGQCGMLQLLSIPLSPTRLLFAYPAFWRGPDGPVIDGVEELRQNFAAFHDLMLLNEQPCRYVYASRSLDDNRIVKDKVVHLRTTVQQVLARCR